MVNLFSSLMEQSLFSVFGNLELMAFILIAIALFIMIWRGVDFRYALMLIAPSVARIAEGGWIPSWINLVLWFVVVGFGLYLGWKALVPNY